MKNLKVNRNNNITASIVQDSKSLQSKMLPIISILLSAFTIIVSIYTYHDSKKINERIRYGYCQDLCAKLFAGSG